MWLFIFPPLYLYGTYVCQISSVIYLHNHMIIIYFIIFPKISFTTLWPPISIIPCQFLSNNGCHCMNLNYYHVKFFVLIIMLIKQNVDEDCWTKWVHGLILFSVQLRMILLTLKNNSFHISDKGILFGWLSTRCFDNVFILDLVV